MILHSYVEQVMTMCHIAFILSELFPLDGFRCIFVSTLLHSGHDDVSCTRMTTFAFILSELFPLDGFRCNFMSAP